MNPLGVPETLDDLDLLAAELPCGDSHRPNIVSPARNSRGDQPYRRILLHLMGETIVDLIRDTQHALNQSGAEAAAILNVSQPTFNRWSNGVTVPSETKVAALARWSKRKPDDIRQLVADARGRMLLRARHLDRQAKADSETKAQVSAILELCRRNSVELAEIRELIERQTRRRR